MPKFLFDLRVYAEAWVTADSEAEARSLIKQHVRLHNVYICPGSVEIEQEPITDDAIRLAEAQSEQETGTVL